MSDPWDIAPIPAQGDERSDDTHAAKGRAVSQWEVLEVALSGLYAVLSGHSRSDLAARQQYGDGEQISFTYRLARLERLGQPYFLAHCDQEYEGEFERLTDAARRFCQRRNELTHSWVRPVQFSRTREKTDTGSDKLTTKFQFFLVPPTYTSRKYDPNNRPKFIYTSVEINAYCMEFTKAKFDVDRLARLIENPKLRASADKPLSRQSVPNTGQPPTDLSEG